MPKVEDLTGGQEIPPEQPSDQLTGWELGQLRKALLELSRRRIESLRLYEPLPVPADFHRSQAPERVIWGSNRAGKTLAAAVEFARAVTGLDPHGKYPQQDGRAYAVGLNLRHVAEVMWRKLSRAGAFKMIRDEQTGLWRAYRPWEPGDEWRAKEAKPAPPLIPPRMIKEIAWENKKEGTPSLVRLVNGWEIRFFSSEGKPPQGMDIDLVWFDEEIHDSDWYPEMSARLLDRAGRFFWSATPQAGSDELYNLHVAAEEMRGTENPRVEEYFASLAANPHISEQQKRDFAAKMTEEERRVRIDGQFAISGLRVFPEFHPKTHGVPYVDIPGDWTIYVVVDPGRQVCAVSFWAVPPPHVGDYVYLYDELYLKACDADTFAARVKDKLAGRTPQEYLIDHQAGRQTEIGSGKTVEEQYTLALKKNDVPPSVASGYTFRWGSSDPTAGLEAFRAWLKVRADGTPRLRVLLDKCPWFRWEIERYSFKKTDGVITDKPVKKHDHLMDTARYIAMRNPVWVPPPKPTERESWVLRMLALKKARRRERDGSDYVRLGPGG